MSDDAEAGNSPNDVMIFPTVPASHEINPVTSASSWPRYGGSEPGDSVKGEEDAAVDNNPTKGTVVPSAASRVINLYPESVTPWPGSRYGHPGSAGSIKEEETELSYLRRIFQSMEEDKGDSRRSALLSRWEDEQTIAVNTISQFSSSFAVVAVFLAGLATSLLAYAGSTFQARTPGTPAKASDAAVYSCFLVSIVLSIVAVALLAHAAVTVAILREKSYPPINLLQMSRRDRQKDTKKQYEPARDSAKNGLLFVYLTFAPLIVGLVILEWADFSKAPAIAVTVAAVLSVLLLMYMWTFGKKSTGIIHKQQY